MTLTNARTADSLERKSECANVPAFSKLPKNRLLVAASFLIRTSLTVATGMEEHAGNCHPDSFVNQMD